MYKCTLTDYTCTKGGAIPAAVRVAEARRRRKIRGRHRYRSWRRPGGRAGIPATPARWRWWGGRFGHGRADVLRRPSPGCGAWWPGPRSGGAATAAGAPAAAETPVCSSFDGKWEALIENFNVFLRQTRPREPADALELRRFRGQLLYLRGRSPGRPIPTSGGLSHAARLRPAGSLHRIVARRPGSAQDTTSTLPQSAHSSVLPQTGRRARHRVSRALRCRDQEGNRNRPRAVSECL